MKSPRPRTGERRKTNQPLKLDRMPEAVREAIVYLRNRRFLTYEQIEELSARPYSKDWQTDEGGFVNWDSLPTELLEQFPALRIPHSSIHRYYDLRVRQVQTQVLKESETARAFAEKFAGANIDEADQAVINAMRDEVFTLAGKLDEGSRIQYMEALNQLTLAMSRIQRVQLLKRKVTVDERKVAQMEKDAEAKREAMKSETEKVARDIAGGRSLTLDDLNRLRRNTFGLPPLGTDGKEVAA